MWTSQNRMRRAGLLCVRVVKGRWPDLRERAERHRSNARPISEHERCRLCPSYRQRGACRAWRPQEAAHSVLNCGPSSPKRRAHGAPASFGLHNCTVKAYVTYMDICMLFHGGMIRFARGTSRCSSLLLRVI